VCEGKQKELEDNSCNIESFRQQPAAESNTSGPSVASSFIVLKMGDDYVRRRMSGAGTFLLFFSGINYSSASGRRHTGSLSVGKCSSAVGAIEFRNGSPTTASA